MESLSDYLRQILYSPKLEDKLVSIPENIFLDNKFFEVKDFPEREEKISFSDKKSKIPRLEHLNSEINRAISIHHFANHELMAIELFAWALLKFPNMDDKTKLDTLKTISEEQKHFLMYKKRMNELGLDFGDRPLNQIFWKYTKYMTSFEKFTSILSISFEGANLDFSLVYEKAFENYGDKKSANIMNQVFKDEIKHVKRGLNFLESKKKNISFWEYYNSLIEHPFTPRRAKGFFYIPETRRKVGFEEDFIFQLGEYKDEFSNRKKEIIPEELLDCGIYTG